MYYKLELTMYYRLELTMYYYCLWYDKLLGPSQRVVTLFPCITYRGIIFKNVPIVQWMRQQPARFASLL